MNTARLKLQLLQNYGRASVVLRNGLVMISIATPFVLMRGEQPLPDAGQTLGAVAHEEAIASAGNPRQRVITDYLARRYRIANDAIEQLVDAAHRTGQSIGLDPLLILSVMAIESRFNPYAQSEMGAKGLMQVMPQQHQDKLAEYGGKDAVLDPMTNILVGARILKECIRRGGGLEEGLQLYAGAFGDPSNQYAQKVIAVKDRLSQVLRRSTTQPPQEAVVSRSATANSGIDPAI